ncbi:MAG: hypothetical protein LC119_15135 [Burkholderiales bacterium]|nr:hypothetical protein [Burkholderiales bacterium]
MIAADQVVTRLAARLRELAAEQLGRCASWEHRARCQTDLLDAAAILDAIRGADDERRAPVQAEHNRAVPFPVGTIAWSEHVEAWEVYARRFGRGQSAERMAERGGFSMLELCSFLGRPPRTWRPA